MPSTLAKASDAIRINDLTLVVPLLTGAQWAPEDAEPIEQPISISVSILHDASSIAKTDDASLPLNMAEIAQKIRTSIGTESFVCIQDLSRHISDTMSYILVDVSGELELLVRVEQIRAPLHTKMVAIEHIAKCSSDGSWAPSRVTHFVEDIICPTIIGASRQERVEKQDVVVNLSIDTGEQGLETQEWIDLRLITREVYEEVTSSKFETLEALASSIATSVLSILKSYQPSPIVSVRIAKPSALVFASSAEVHLQRTFADYPSEFQDPCCQDQDLRRQTSTLKTSPQPGGRHIAVIALGSNLGDSFHNLDYALRLLEIPSELLSPEDARSCPDPVADVVDTSFLYETKPMYVTDQPSFINCACMIETNLPPRVLLRLMKTIETTVGRLPSIRNGPRAVDLDIVFYDSEVIDTRQDRTTLDNLEGELVVPHPRLQEREFVLRPLNDMIPDYWHPLLGEPIHELFKKVCNPDETPMKKVIPFPRLPLTPSVEPLVRSIPSVPSTLCCWSYSSTDNIINSSSADTAHERRTHIMATLNVTPDSFSDGAVNEKLPSALSYICSSVAAGASIVDVGGYSTRPGAAFVSIEDEIGRVLPAIRAMRDENTHTSLLHASPDSRTEKSSIFTSKILNTPISVDTFRWQVAEAAIQAGANCINDVYAFTGPDSWPPQPETTPDSDAEALQYMANMKAIARKFAVPVVLMHSRGDAGKNKDYGAYQYAADSRGRGTVLEGVRVELGAKVDKIVKGKGGVRRWMVIVDPGIGFSKTLEGNLEVLRAAKDVVADLTIGDGASGTTYRNPLRGYPQLLGASRKSFLGTILANGPEGRETKPAERNFATAAAVACAVQQDALILRVHDAQDMMDVVKVAAALYL